MAQQILMRHIRNFHEREVQRQARHLPLLVDAHLARGGVVKHAVHHLHLRVVVPRAQRPHLHGRHARGVLGFTVSEGIGF